MYALVPHITCFTVYSTHSSVKVLMEFGADPNLRDNCDQTSLHLALRSGHGPTAQCLLQAGTSLTIVTKVCASAMI